MWLLLAFTSAALLGFYDVFKKQALKTHAVVPVLTLNTLFCSLIFLPLVLLSWTGHIAATSAFYVPATCWAEQRYVLLKAVIVLSSWICGYMAIKNLPLTLVCPINATRPVMVLLGAILVFGEHLNLYQWMGVCFAILGFYMLSRSGKKEGIDFRHNRWVALAVLASALGAVSALYDKFLLAAPEAGGVGLNRMVVQSYFNFYQFGMMSLVLLAEGRGKPKAHPTHDARESLGSHWFKGSCWGWLSIPLISLFLSAADFAYFYALSLPTALISVVSMIRRGSVLVSFSVGAVVFREKNLRSKAIDLALVLLSMVFLWLGSK
ncbi:MAG: DMT family transporter [Bacteroidaceae bacterium]|nr:DMT family transporter [Bacteroidaceae bacterium]